MHVIAAAALEASRLDLHHLKLVVREPAFDLQHLGAGLEGHRIDDDDDIRIDADRPVDDRTKIALTAADEDAVRDRQRTLVGDILPLIRCLEALCREAGRGDAAHDADVVDLELVAVLLERVDRVLIHLDRNHLSLRTGQRSLNRHTAGAGADVIHDAVLAKSETAEAQRTHIALRHRDPIEPVEALIRDTEASYGCTEAVILKQRDGEAVEALIPKLARGADGKLLILVAQALADRDAHVIEAELYQLLRDDGDIVLGTEQGADETVLADQRHHVLMQAVQADELHVRHADRALAEEVLDARHAGIVPDLELLEHAVVLIIFVVYLRHVLFQRATQRNRAGVHAGVAGEDRRDGFLFRVREDVLDHLLRAEGLEQLRAALCRQRRPCRVQRPRRPHHHIRCRDGIDRTLRQHIRISRAYPDQVYDSHVLPPYLQLSVRRDGSVASIFILCRGLLLPPALRCVRSRFSRTSPLFRSRGSVAAPHLTSLYHTTPRPGSKPPLVGRHR